MGEVTRDYFPISTCKGCGKQIKWVRMISGAKMPVDPEELSVVSIDPVSGQGIARRGFKVHWQTCSEAKQFRKRKGGRK